MKSESESFDAAVSWTIDVEGKPNEVPGDRGGTTKWGISRAFLQSISDGPVTSSFVLGLSYSDAKEIYRNHFWYKPKIHKIPSDRIRHVLFDQAVNRGPNAAIKNLQSALIIVSKRNIEADGVIGSQTINAVREFDSDDLFLSFIQESQLSYVSLVKSDITQLKFLSGWLNRTWKYF